MLMNQNGGAVQKVRPATNQDGMVRIWKEESGAAARRDLLGFSLPNTEGFALEGLDKH